MVVSECPHSLLVQMFVQIEEVKFAIRKLSFVTVLSPVRAVGDKGKTWRVVLTCLL